MPFVASGHFYKSISALLSMLNFVLFVIAHASPTWTAYIADLDHFLIGLWFFCSDKYGCQFLGTSDASLNVTRIFMLFALIMSFVALAFSMPWEWMVRYYSPFLPRPVLISISSFIAAVCSLIAVVLFGVQVDQKSEVTHTSGKTAFYLSCSSSAFSFLAAVYNGLVYKFSLWEVASSGRIEDVQKSVKLDVVRSFMLVALFFSLLAILCSVELKYWMNCTEDFFMEGPIAAIFSLSAGICVLVAVVVFDASVRSVTEPQLSDPSAKWAFSLSCVVCALCFATGIFSLVLYQLSLWKATSYSSQVTPKA